MMEALKHSSSCHKAARTEGIPAVYVVLGLEVWNFAATVPNTYLIISMICLEQL